MASEMTDMDCEPNAVWCPEAQGQKFLIAEDILSILRTRVIYSQDGYTDRWDEHAAGTHWIRKELDLVHRLLCILDRGFVPPAMDGRSVEDYMRFILPVNYCRVELLFLRQCVELGGSQSPDLLRLCYRDRFAILRYFASKGLRIVGI
jgi:hypothetical protein